MKTLRVNLPGREYDIHIGHGLLNRAEELINEVFPDGSNKKEERKFHG